MKGRVGIEAEVTPEHSFFFAILEESVVEHPLQ